MCGGKAGVGGINWGGRGERGGLAISCLSTKGYIARGRALNEGRLRLRIGKPREKKTGIVEGARRVLESSST